MPIYAFECAACGHSFDRLQKLSDADPSACPACGEPQVRRRLTAPSFRLAGGGWYETDFKKDGRRNLADGSGDAAAKAGATPEAVAKPADTPAADPKPAPAPPKPAPPKPAAD